MNPQDTTNSSTTNNQHDPMQQCMSTLDQLIHAGGASAEDLQNLKMDLQDAMGGEASEPNEPPTSGNPSDMSSMIDNMQRGA